MYLKAEFVKAVGTKNGLTKNNEEWKVTTALFRTVDKYPKDVAVEFWNNNVQALAGLVPGAAYSIGIDISSREHNGNYYTTAKGWSVLPLKESAASAAGDEGGDQPQEDGLPF